MTLNLTAHTASAGKHFSHEPEKPEPTCGQRQAMKQGYWTEARDASLKHLADEGLSASVIAERLGGDITKNAVIGRCRRLNIDLALRPGPPTTRVPATRKPVGRKPKPRLPPGEKIKAGPAVERDHSRPKPVTLAGGYIYDNGELRRR